MNLRPRHYVLLVVILGLAVWNIVRSHRPKPAPQSAPTQIKLPAAQRGISPVWAFYDRVAELRDAPDAQFRPALDQLNQHLDTANGVAVPPQTSNDEIADLKGCRTWLLFYRQARGGGGAQQDWLKRSETHVRSCVTNHRDVAS